MIGAAYFWNKEELNRYYDTHPIYRYSQRPLPFCDSRCKAAEAVPESSACGSAEAKKDMYREEPQEQAGTGMGETESNPTYQVAFDYDTGMYFLSRALVVYYDFVKVPSPNPFPAIGYAPEMP